MQQNEVVIRFYNTINEEERLQKKSGQVEFLTTMRYIHKYLKPGMKVLEVGAGTGRYSLAIAREGYEVDAIELVERNIDLFRSKVKPGDTVRIRQGNAMDLSVYNDKTFDITLLLGPMYHIFENIDKKRALEEALRVTKKDGIIFIAYCMNEPTLIQYCFQKETIWEDKRKGLLSEDFIWTPNENDAFSLVRTEDILGVTEGYPVHRLHLVATDGATKYMEEKVDGMSDELFDMYLKYHYSICERNDLLGASNHTMDILKKL